MLKIETEVQEIKRRQNGEFQDSDIYQLIKIKMKLKTNSKSNNPDILLLSPIYLNKMLIA